jgi:hypothetical protein
MPSPKNLLASRAFAFPGKEKFYEESDFLREEQKANKLFYFQKTAEDMSK